MGITKTDLYNPADLELAAIAKALAHPARIAIIRCLLASKQCITGDLTEQIGLAQPTISQHLKELKAIHIIQGTISGTSVNYCINPSKWQHIATLWASLFSEFPQENTCC
jgi:ArsR family transcriptional regulator, zinc-responsive transcriptional repressor